MKPLEIGSRLELFVDRTLIEKLDGAQLRLHEPVSGGVAIRIDKPWEGPVNFGISVLHYKGRYLMYYRAMTLDPKDLDGVMCVAVSDDGVTWTKPALGLVDRNGRHDTNIIADEEGQSFYATPWLDTRPGVPDNERIKLLKSVPLDGTAHTAYTDPGGAKRLVVWGSADGFSFHKLDPQPEIVSKLPNAFDGGNTMFWSEAEGQYALYFRCSDGYRTMARTTSKDFLHWTEPVLMTYGNSPREHLYDNNTDPYFRAPHLYIALAPRFMSGRRALTDAQVKAAGLTPDPKFPQDPEWIWHDCADAVLLTSRTGSTQYDRTFMEGFVRPGLGTGNWVSRTNYPLTGLYPCNPEHMMFWVSRHYMQNSWYIERLLLRTDGFASVNAPYAGGEVMTKPFTFTGKNLVLNYATSAAGSICVEIQDAAGAPLPGYTLADCPEIIGDEIERAVTWINGNNLSAFAGHPVRLRFVMKDADLYSLRFK